MNLSLDRLYIYFFLFTNGTITLQQKQLDLVGPHGIKKPDFT
jgi:hypothetical protein